MTPAIIALEKEAIDYKLHSYAHQSSSSSGVSSYGLEAAEKLGIDPAQMFKTLVLEKETGVLCVALVPVSGSLNLKKMAKAAACKKCVMAAASKVVNSTGYVLGGVSPLGQKRGLQTLIDRSLEQWQTVFVSAGKRGLQLELTPSTLQAACQAQLADLAQQ